MKEFACGQVVPDCSATFQAETEEEILQQVAAHAREAHGISDVPPELAEQVKAGISER